MPIKYELDHEQSMKLFDAMAKIPKLSEELANKVLHGGGSQLMIQKIIDFTPVSKVDKKHAKSSKPLKDTMINLGFEIKTKGGAAKNKGSFGYLVFPNEGRGSSNPIAQRFFEKGMEQSNPEIFEQLLAALDEAHNIIGK